MALVPFRQIQTTDTELQRLQSNLEDTIASLQAGPFADCTLLPRVSLVAGSNVISHGLGKNFRSWAWLAPSAATQLSEGPSPDRSKYLVVVASAPAVVDLVVL